MKLVAIFMFVLALQVSAKGRAQGITLSEKNAPLEKLFKEIRKQTGFSFIYTQQMLEGTKKVDVKLQNVSIKKALDECLKDQPLTYTIINSTIVIKPRNESPNEPPTNLISLEVAPAIDISGRVTDPDGEPLNGATIRVRGANRGVSTDVNGYFTLKGIDENAVMEISYVGFEKIVINISLLKLRNNVVVLRRTESPLNEIQVIAYGTRSKRLQTGNVTTVKAADIARQPVSNPLLALQDRVPSLFITQSTGFPGSGVAVRIQGQNTISGQVGNDPLYIVDGVPYPSRLLATLSSIQGGSGNNVPSQANFAAGYGNPLSFINPDDIESIEVLKDADATAIYGSRAANGAILITTKKGKAGQTKVDINVQNGWGKVARKLDLLNTRQYLQMRREALNNDGLTPSASPTALAPFSYAPDLMIWDTTRSTDWQKELIGGTAAYQDVQANVSGGNANTQVLVGAGYHRETSVLPGDLSDQKGSLHFNITNTSNNKKFRLQLTGSYMVDNNKLIYADLTNIAMQLPPNAPAIYNTDGTLNWQTLPNGNSTWANPLANLHNEYNSKTSNLVGSAVISYKILPNLDIQSNFGYTNLQSNEMLIFPLLGVAPEKQATTLRSSQFNNNNINSWVAEPQLSYKQSIGKGRLEALLGLSVQQSNGSHQMITGTGFNTDAVMHNLSSAPSLTTSTGASVYKYNAVFGRLNYNWQDKYLVSLTARRDGSSRFGSENQLHNFGSVGGAWILSQEKFFKKNIRFISFAKLRGSYGTTGNDQIGDYQFLSLYNNVTGTNVAYQGTTGIAPANLPNAYLQWEETRKLQFGLDLGVLDDRIVLNANYYHNHSSNQLLGYALPIVTGFASISQNFPAVVENYGWELSINSKNLATKDFKWTSNFSLTIPHNKLVAFPNLASSSYSDKLIIGQPVTMRKALVYMGVDPASGVYLFADKNGNATSFPSLLTDATKIWNLSPELYGALQNSFIYKGLELAISFQYVKQQGPNPVVGTGIGPGGGPVNQPVTVLDRWQKPGDVKPIQRYNTNFSLVLPYIYATGSTIAISDASYVRLKNLSLSWQLPLQWMKKVHLQNARLYTQAQNLLTITKYSGLDPETMSSTTLPPLCVIVVGFQLSL